MQFASDNAAGISEPILAAIAAANGGAVPSYGADPLSRHVEARFAEIFERDAAIFFVATGTAANALSLAAAAPPWSAIFCHREAHVMTDECGAPEFYSAGARLVGLSGQGAKLDPNALKEALAGWPIGDEHQIQPAAVTISQVSEYGLVFRPDEIAAIGEIAERYGLFLHMDGARFANAVAALGCPPADITWRAGVDILSFGATKNGALGAEAIVVFRPELAETLRYRRKRAGHLISKSRFVAAQFEAYLKDDHWLELARHANAMAARLGATIEAAEGARLAAPVEANEVFAFLEEEVDARLRKAGAVYHQWPAAGPGMAKPASRREKLVRFVTSFATSPREVQRLAEALNV